MANRFVGYVETVEPALSGWILDRDRPGPVKLSVVIDAALRFALIADRPRPDVVAAGAGPLHCGFAVTLPAHLLDGRPHAIDLFAEDGSPLELASWRSPIVLGPLSCRIATLGPADRDDVAAMLRLTSAESGVDPDTISDRHVDAWIRGVHRVLGARAAMGLVGYAVVERRERIGAVGLSVLRHYRRKGVGERLMRALLTAVRDDGQIAQLWLAVAPENLPARRLYEKLGFVDQANPPPGLVTPTAYSTMLWRPDR